MTNKLTEKRVYWANHVKAWKASGETQCHERDNSKISRRFFKAYLSIR